MNILTEGKKQSKRRLLERGGFTLIEVVISIAVFGILMMTVIGISQQIHNLASNARLKTTAATIAQEQIELIRNLPYESVGTDVTYPTGPLASTQNISRNGGTFTVTLSINYVDDPSDGVLPTDTVPADFKKVEARVCWSSASCARPVRLTTFIVPKTLEYATNAGALFITVIDSNGLPVSGATVHVTNASPAVDVINQTDVTGQLQLLNLPASANSYRVTATKAGFSSDTTVPVSVGNPNPENPDATVLVGDKNDVTLAIDRVSTLTVKALDQTTCDGLGGVSVRIIGERLIGQNPNIPAYDQTFVTDANGQFIIANLPWDNYSFSVTSAGDDVAGVTPPDSVQVNPGSSVTGSVILAAHQGATARIIVRDAGTHGPIANAIVSMNDGGAYSTELITDQGILQQNNWVGGPGQTNFIDITSYAADSGAIDTSQANSISIATQSLQQTVSEDFHDTSHRDLAATTADWNTSNETVQLPSDPITPGQFIASAQAQSEKLNGTNGQITTVTLTSNETTNGETITYAVAADGGTFETVTPGVAHTFAVTGSDLRWKISLDTSNLTITPSVTDLQLTYTILTRPVNDATITSSTFDSGGPTNYTTLSWQPSSQPSAAGGDAVRFQIASAGTSVGAGGPVVDVSSSPTTTPLFTKNIGDAVTTTYIAQSFVAGSSDTIESIDIKIAQHGIPTTAVTAFIYSDSANAPANNLSGSGQDITVTVPSDTSSTWQDAWTTQPFSPNTALVAGTKYWLVFSINGSNSSKYWTVVRSNADTTYSGGTARVGGALSSLGALCVTGCDIAFQIRRSGVTETAITPTDFVGPDGTAGTYYTTSGSTLNTIHNGFRYLRYKLFLHTDDPSVTPTINRMSIIKNNACTPPGQVFFSPLPANGDYSVNVSADGYQPGSVPMTISGNASQYVELAPNP